MIFLLHMPKFILHIRKMKFAQKSLGSLWAEEQYREGKNKMPIPVETLPFLCMRHRNAKNIKMTWREQNPKCAKSYLLYYSSSSPVLSTVSCTPFPNYKLCQLAGIKWHTLLFAGAGIENKASTCPVTHSSSRVNAQIPGHQADYLKCVSFSVITPSTSASPNACF